MKVARNSLATIKAAILAPVPVINSKPILTVCVGHIMYPTIALP
jgi:hypothetical protein